MPKNKTAPLTPHEATYPQDTEVRPSDKEKTSVITTSALKVQEHTHIIRFRGRAMIEQHFSEVNGVANFSQFVPLHKEDFERITYPILGGISRTRVLDVFAYVINMAPDLTCNEHLIAFGTEDNYEVWDTKKLEFDTQTPYQDVIWRSPYYPSASQEKSEFILSLAGGDPLHYADILQSMAPIIMHTKPDGAIWWIGSGANGKSSLMDALYRIFPFQLASLTIKRLTDERDTPLLNGQLANVVKESSEGRIDDTQIYKSIGTHEDFRVHKFHSQDSMLINGNMHHIFSGNSIPTFNDKGYSARRRTFIVPFTQVFTSDPDFEKKTFTYDNLCLIVSEMLRYARQLRTQQLLYKFSQVATEAKAEYDAEANTAEDYAKDMIEQGVVGFDSFGPVKVDYENWCAENGYTPLGIANLRRAMQSVGFERTSVKTATGVGKKYRLQAVSEQASVPWGMGKPGFYTAPGFRPSEAPKPQQPTQQDLSEEW